MRLDTDRGATLPRNGKITISERIALTVSALWRNKLWILFLMLAAAGVFSWYGIRMDARKASATLTLRYEQAYEGLNPNGTRFNIYELLGDAVLDKAIERAGLTGELTTGELLDHLAVSASGSQSAGNLYIATEYHVSLDGNCLPRRIPAQSMLRLLMEVYKQYFLENYGSNDSALDIDWSDVEEWEYLEYADIMNVKVNNLITYLENLRSESGMSQYRIGGETFRSLQESISNFRDIYLNRYTSFVTVNHLFRNAPLYREKLDYRRFLARQELNDSSDRYGIYQDALKMYDESMITFVMVPMYDSDNSLYMARTSIGMDSLTEMSKSFAEKMQVSDKKLKTIELDQKSAAAGSSDPEKLKMADEMIADMQKHLDSLIARIRLAKKDYEVYRSRNSIQYTLSHPSFAGFYHLKGAIAAAAAVFFLSVIYYSLYSGKRGRQRL